MSGALRHWFRVMLSSRADRLAGAPSMPSGGRSVRYEFARIPLKATHPAALVRIRGRHSKPRDRRTRAWQLQSNDGCNRQSYAPCGADQSIQATEAAEETQDLVT